jgi:hypothetical protein
MLRWVLLLQLAVFSLASCACAACGFVVEGTTRVTNSEGKSQTARGNARCICVDAEGTVHLVWTDDRDGNVEIYYTTIVKGKVSPETRLTSTPGESSFPCIASSGDSVYILWQETVENTTQIWYAHFVRGKQVARKQITTSLLGAACPVCAVGPDNALHVAWHDGTGSLTGIYYGKIVGDDLVAKVEICTKHPGAFRPDIAVDPEGRVLLAWFEGLDIKSKLWDGNTWGPETLVVTNKNRGWRLSLADLGPQRWALAWFDQTSTSTDVLAKFYDGTKWHDQVRVNTGQTGFYPATASLGGGRLLVAWEDQDKPKSQYLLLMRCFDGRTWGEPTEIARHRAMSRYCSLAPAGTAVHAIWFSPEPGNDEIFYGLLRRK